MRIQKRTRKFKITVITSLLTAGLLVGCGGTPYATFTPNSSTTSAATTSTTTTTTTTSSTGSTTTTSNLPAITDNFSLNGPGGTVTSYSTSVNTDNVLSVEITAGAAGQMTLGTYSNYSATYGCISYSVEANGYTQSTGTLAVSSDSGTDYNCPSAAQSATLDFSSTLSPGHGETTITVTPIGYDFYCQYCESYPSLFGYACAGYCPLHSIYKTHTVTGTIAITVNGT